MLKNNIVYIQYGNKGYVECGGIYKPIDYLNFRCWNMNQKDFDTYLVDIREDLQRKYEIKVASDRKDREYDHVHQRFLERWGEAY